MSVKMWTGQSRLREEAREPERMVCSRQQHPWVVRNCQAVKRTRELSADLAVEDAKCLRVSRDLSNASDLANPNRVKGELGVLADEQGPHWSPDQASELEEAQHKLRTYRYCVEQSSRQANLSLLMDMQRLGTCVSVLLGEALSAADKRHFGALQSHLNMLENSHLHRVFRLVYGGAYKHCPSAWSDEVPCCHFGSSPIHASNSRQQSNLRTFAKVVSSYDYYCNNPAKFAESDTSRRRNIQQMAELLKLVIRDEVHQLDGLVTDDAVNAYLKEWSSVENVRVQRNIPGGHLVSLSKRKGTQDARRDAEVFDKILTVEKYVEEIPLLAKLSGKVVWDDIYTFERQHLATAV
ncbi:hypothetical protein ABBQ38_009381 [Trebouxia sp. C0009 RCD-2024]